MMEQCAAQMLELLDRPAFLVKDGTIMEANSFARELGIPLARPVAPLLEQWAEAYASYSQGHLALNVLLPAGLLPVTVHRLEPGLDLFDGQRQDGDESALRFAALAAAKLREPLSSVMAAAQSLAGDLDASPSQRESLRGMNHALFCMMRILNNMADAHRYCSGVVMHREETNLVFFCQEFFDRLELTMEPLGIRVAFSAPNQDVLAAIDRQMVERAMYNLVSNALTQMRQGGCLRAWLTATPSHAVLRLEDDGTGLSGLDGQDLFHRYRRALELENGQVGLGLGLTLARQAAALHGGAVLLDGTSHGTAVVFSVRRRPETGTDVRAPRVSVDYAGQWDHSLVELAEILPDHAYDDAAAL